MISMNCIALFLVENLEGIQHYEILILGLGTRRCKSDYSRI